MCVSLIGRQLTVSRKQSWHQEPLTVFPAELTGVFSAAKVQLQRRSWETKWENERDAVTKQQRNFQQVPAEITEWVKGLQKAGKQNEGTVKEKSEGCKTSSIWVYKLPWNRNTCSDAGRAVDGLWFLQGRKLELWEHMCSAQTVGKIQSCTLERCSGGENSAGKLLLVNNNCYLVRFIE